MIQREADLSELLNPALYRRLEARYGSVRVVSAGTAADLPLSRDPFTGRVKRTREISGEEYILNCPFCNDTRQRMTVNHRWGVWDDETGTYNLWLAQCYNEQCLASTGNQQQLFNILQLPRRKLGRITVRAGKRLAATDKVEVELPGELMRLDKLLARHPRHHALRYLQDRGLDPEYLGRRWGVGYCADSHYRLASDRIIIPCYEQKELVGWQARYIGDDVHGQSFKDAGIPKYWSCPHMQRALVGYNFERAVTHPTVVVVEGPADVWKVGLQGMGLLGKTINPLLVQKLWAAMQAHDQEQVVIVVMLDPNQDKVSKKKGRPHHIKVAQLALRKKFGRSVLPIYLPPDTDPGGLARPYLWEYVRTRAQKAGLPVSFARPVRAR